MIYTCKPRKVSIYVNTDRKTAQEVLTATGCDAVINGGLFTMSSFRPVCHLKVDGRVLSTDLYTYWGYGWNDADLTMISGYRNVQNYICCLALVRNGQPEPLYYDTTAMGGARERTAMGTFPDGRLWLYASSDKRTPEQLREIALQAGVQDAIMLDGGGSTQGVSPAGSVSSARRVHNLICVWAEEEEQKPIEGSETPMFKIALGAGHGIGTAGKRCMKALDPNETREWWLNDRICDYVESYLKDHDGYSLLRLDDSDDGKDDVPLATRTNKANAWGADFYLSVHHNAGINGGTGGGIVAYTHPQSSKASVEWRDALYNALIAHTGLKGNRSTPKATADYHVLRETKAPAVLLELGFMDSQTDVPVILTNEYAQACARAIVEVLVKRGKLTKKAKPETGKLYKVQVGAFSKVENANRLAAELKAKGYQTYVVEV